MANIRLKIYSLDGSSICIIREYSGRSINPSLSNLLRIDGSIGSLVRSKTVLQLFRDSTRIVFIASSGVSPGKLFCRSSIIFMESFCSLSIFLPNRTHHTEIFCLWVISIWSRPLFFKCNAVMVVTMFFYAA